MTETVCQGLPADWLNGWLAAVGATFMAPLELRWTEGGTPAAALAAPGGVDPVEALAAAWPAELDLPISRAWRDTPPMPRGVTVETFAARASVARTRPHAWALSSTLTDLDVGQDGRVADAPFNPPAPRGTTLDDRLRRVHGAVDPTPARLAATLAGTGERVEGNGLGFDLSRLGSQADASSPRVDPVVEVLAFFGLAILPHRGRGTDRRISRQARPSAVQRGWRGRPSRFTWPAWSPPLDSAAIDALLDAWDPGALRSWRRLGVHAAWRSVRFQRRGASDVTRGFGSERFANPR